MTRFDILFETDRFNVSEVKEHFINPYCFGEDLAEWLRQRLALTGVNAGAPYREDWGWEMLTQHDSEQYYLGVGGCLIEGAASKNDGAWRIMIEKNRSTWEKLRARNTIPETEPILSIVEDILREQADVRNLRRESVSL
jgi:hypothetical protein